MDVLSLCIRKMVKECLIGMLVDVTRAVQAPHHRDKMYNQIKKYVLVTLNLFWKQRKKSRL